MTYRPNMNFSRRTICQNMLRIAYHYEYLCLHKTPNTISASKHFSIDHVSNIDAKLKVTIVDLHRSKDTKSK